MRTGSARQNVRRFIVTIPLAPRTARAISLAVGERVEGPIFLGGNGERLDRHAASRIVRRLAAVPGSTSPSDRTLCVTRSSPPPSTPVSRFATCRRLRLTPILGPRCATTALGSPWIGTRPTWSLRSWPVPLADELPREALS